MQCKHKDQDKTFLAHQRELSHVGSDGLAWLRALGVLVGAPANDTDPDEPPPAAPAAACRAQTLPPPFLVKDDIFVRIARRVVRGTGRKTREEGFFFVPGPSDQGGSVEVVAVAPRSGFACSFAVADSAGDEPAGNLASELALHTLRTASPHGRWPFDPWERIDAVGRAFRDANAALRDALLEDIGFGGTAASITHLSIVDRVLLVTHLGNTGAILVRQGHAEPLTRPHTVGAELVSRGVLTQAEAAKLPFCSRLSRAVGRAELVTPSFAVRELRAGDVIVVGSNGLWDTVGADKIAALVTAQVEPAYACEQLAAMASIETWDDATVVVMRIDGPGLQ